MIGVFTIFGSIFVIVRKKAISETILGRLIKVIGPSGVQFGL